MASDESGAASSSHSTTARTAAQPAIAVNARAASWAVAALRMRHHVLTTEEHITKPSFNEHLRLVGEMRRPGVAAFAAAHDGLGTNGRAELHRRDETISD